ncbi:hypothetical protein ACJZ2D_006527 [Fusarium nematophilum]
MCHLNEKRFICARCNGTIYNDRSMQLCEPFLQGRPKECGRAVILVLSPCEPALCLICCTMPTTDYWWVKHPKLSGPFGGKGFLQHRLPRGNVKERFFGERGLEEILSWFD